MFENMKLCMTTSLNFSHIQCFGDSIFPVYLLTGEQSLKRVTHLMESLEKVDSKLLKAGTENENSRPSRLTVFFSSVRRARESSRKIKK